MKTKTINKTLSAKFDAFAASITDKTVRELVKNNTIITGGCIVSMLLKENVNDYDMYFRNQETTVAVAKYYVDKFKANPPPTFKESARTIEIGVKNQDGRIRIVIKSAGVAGESKQDDYQYFETIAGDAEQADSADRYVSGAINNIQQLDEEAAEKLDDKSGERYRPIFMSSNAITLANKVQLIVRFYGEPEDIHSNYDFAHCTSYWCSWTRQVTLRPEALESIITRELRYVGSKYPICSMIRTRKFVARGWTINAGMFLKMAWQISELNLKDIEVLEDQLVGVDAAYFAQVIAILRKSDDPKKIEGTYLMTVIDKLF